jgi:hypothetical protein
MSRIGSASDDVYGIYVSVGDGSGVYHDVVSRPEVFGGALEDQADSIASSIMLGFTDLTGMSNMQTSIVDGMTADRAQCTIIALLPAQSMQIAIPARLSWSGGRPLLAIDRRTVAPWRHDGAGIAYVDWDRIERVTKAYVTDAARLEPAIAVDPYALPMMHPLDLLDTGAEETNLPRPPDDADGPSDAASPAAAEASDAPSPATGPSEEPKPPEDATTRPSAPASEAKPDKPARKKGSVDPVSGLPQLPDVREVTIPDGVGAVAVMEDVELAGSDSIEWNSHAHVIRQYQVLAQKLPLLGGQAMEIGENGPFISVAMRDRFPWMEEAVEAITHACQEQLAAGRSWFTMRPTLLVGPAGCGKSSFARALAETARLGWNMLDCGSVSDAVTISGTPRGYTTATPNFAAVSMERTSTANPVIHLDEIEKASRSRQGYLPDAVLSMTEPTTANAYYDQCLQRRIDLTYCTWIATANDVSRLSTPIKSRFRVIEVPPARGEHIDCIIRQIASEVAGEWSLAPGDLAEIPGESRRLLASQLDRGSLRTVTRSLRMLWSRDLIENGRASLN